MQITLQQGKYPMRISIIIPAYNEAEGVEQNARSLMPIVARLREDHEVEVIYVNDGSKDDTYALLQAQFAGQPGIIIETHSVNRGLGAALRTGFARATGDILITTDFDGTYAYDTLPDILAQFLRDNVDIVTASPYHPLGKVDGVPRFRLMFSFGASLLYRLLVKRGIYCWTALFRVYRRQVIQAVPFTSNDFLAGTELLVNALRSGFTVSEFPATLHVRTYGQSSMKVARVTRAHLGFQAAILWSRLTRRTTQQIAARQS